MDELEKLELLMESNDEDIRASYEEIEDIYATLTNGITGYNDLKSSCLLDNIDKMPIEEQEIALESINDYLMSIGMGNISLEEITLSKEEKSNILDGVQDTLRSIFNKLVDVFKSSYDRIVNNNLVMSSYANSIYNSIHEWDDKNYNHEAILSNDECLGIADRFTTIIVVMEHVKNNHDLYRALLSAEPSIAKPKSTAAISNMIQTIIPRADIDTINVSELVFSKDTRPTLGINKKLNDYFYNNAPINIKTKLDRKLVSVVEFSNDKCGGLMIESDSFRYSIGTITLKTNDHSGFDKPLDKPALMALISFVKRLTIQMQGFKTQVDEDIKSGYKIIHSFKNIDSVKSDDEDKKQLNRNLNIIKQHANIVPKMASGNLHNNYAFIRNILWYVKTNFSKIKTHNVEYTN